MKVKTIFKSLLDDKQDKWDKERQVARRVPVEEGGAEQVQCCSSRETRRGQAQTSQAVQPASNG